MNRAALAAALLAALALSCSPRAETPRPWARPLTSRTFERTPERLERGRYLAEGILQCAMCHSERAWDQPGAPPARGREYAGVILWDDSTSRVVAPNLTPDRATGAGRWSDDMLARAIREGVGHDGRALHPQMRYGSFRELSDEDLAAVIVFLRSLPAVRNPLPATRLSAERRRKIEADLEPLAGPVAAHTFASPVERGRNLAGLADCAGCHTSWYSDYNPGVLAGGNFIELGNRTAFSTNITPHETGIGDWTAETFIEVMRSGRFGTMHPLMPWTAFRNLDDDDLAALHAFLATMPAAAHRVDNHSPPDSCGICEQRHGRGGENRRERPAGIRLDAQAIAAFAGTYRSPRYDFTRVLTSREGRLYASEDGGPEIELIPVSADRFAAPGWLAPVRFERDSSGRVVRHYSIEVEDVLLERVR